MERLATSAFRPNFSVHRRAGLGQAFYGFGGKIDIKGAGFRCGGADQSEQIAPAALHLDSGRNEIHLSVLPCDTGFQQELAVLLVGVADHLFTERLYPWPERPPRGWSYQ